MNTERLAVYTTVYPAVLPYLRAWYQSVQAQCDKDFDLWIGVDGLNEADIVATLGVDVSATWIYAAPGATPALIRQHAIGLMVDQYDGVVFVDSDDLLYPTRVATARQALQHVDGAAWALQIIDHQGRDCTLVFAPPPDTDAVALLPRRNVFGLSNSAYRTTLLRRCLPWSAECQLVDWLLATRAWALGATLAFDHQPQMAYRQYATNIAPVLPPFSAQQVARATERVLTHYRCLLESDWLVPAPSCQIIAAAQAEVRCFHAAVVCVPRVLHAYVAALNQLSPVYIWWWAVAHPDLEELWTRS